MNKAVGVLLLSGIGLLPTALGAREVVLPRVESEGEAFRVVKVAGELEHPWAVVFLPDGRALVSERPGRLVLVDGQHITRVQGLPAVSAEGQGGLLDLALHPEYSANGWIYFTYSAGRGQELGTRVARARLQGERLTDLQLLFSMRRGSPAGVHFGSRLAFLPDGSLLFTIGDRGDRDRAQSLQEHAGKTLRLLPDGSVPRDNPFVGRSDALPEIYSYGHRNAQGLAVQPESGWVWLHEHGPRGGDEVNLVEPGRNYGWPRITYGREYSGGRIGPSEAPGLEQPVLHWTPSIAPSGLAFYSGSAFPAWRGSLFAGALAGRQLRRLVLEGWRVVREETLLKDFARIRDVRQGPDGLLYLLTDERNGELLRLEPLS